MTVVNSPVKNAPGEPLRDDPVKIAVEKVIAAIDAEDAEAVPPGTSPVETHEIQPTYVSDLFVSANDSWTQEDENGTRMRASSFYPAVSMAVKITCCLFLLWTKSCTGHDAVLLGLSGCTAAYATASLLCAAVVYRGVKEDRMPFGPYTKLFQLFSCVICGGYALGLVGQKLFGDGDLYFALFPDAKRAGAFDAPRMGHALILSRSCDAAPYVSLAVSVTYCVAVVYDVTDTIFPMLWTRIILNEFVFF